MGGNALKHCTRRYDADEYHEVARRLGNHLASTLGVLSGVIPAYKNKGSFGDVDILVMSDRLHPNWKQALIASLGLKDDEYVSNGDVFTVKFEEIQADLICTPEDHFNASLFYFGYNDLGNLLGRLFHSQGVKLGHKGLYLVVRPRENQLEHVIGEIFLTDDPKTILEILGLDVREYGKFEDIEDIFKFVAGSKYFHPDIFLLENRNCESRVRDRKRKTYNLFLEWCEKNKDHLVKYEHESFDGRFGYHINNEFMNTVLVKYFPDIKVKVDGMIDEFELDQEFKKVFNGQIVKDLTGLEGKNLGMLMKDLKEVLVPKELFIAHPELVEKEILKRFLTYYQKSV